MISKNMFKQMKDFEDRCKKINLIFEFFNNFESRCGYQDEIPDEDKIKIVEILLKDTNWLDK